MSDTNNNTPVNPQDEVWSTYSGGTGVFQYGVNSEVGIKEWAINESEKDLPDGTKLYRKQLVITYVKDNPNAEEGFSKILQYVDYPMPKKGTTEISVKAFQMLLTQLEKFAINFVAKESFDDLIMATRKEIFDKTGQALNFQDLNLFRKQVDILITNVMTLCEQNGLFEDKGNLGLLYNAKGFLTPFRYGLSGVWEVPFNIKTKPTIPNGDDKYFFNVKPISNDGASQAAETTDSSPANNGW